MLQIAVGHSNDPLSDFAIAEVIQQCQETLNGNCPQAGILLAAIDFDHALLLKQIHQAFPGIELIGGTTAGEISSTLKYQQDSIVLILFASDEIEIHAGLGQGMSKDLQAAAQQAIAQALAKSTQPPKFCLAIPDGLTASGDGIVDSLKQVLGTAVPIFGGLAGAQTHNQAVYQFFQTEVLQDAVPVLIFSGPILFSHGVANGWQPIGNPTAITQSSQNVVYRIGNKSAFEFYDSYLGQPPSEEYPLAIFAAGEQRFYTRSPIAYDSEAGSVTFGGNVPEGVTAQITEATRDMILAASQTSIQQALTTYPGTTPAAALFFSCTARRHILGSYTRKEYDLAEDYFTQTMLSAGFYTFGEISPLEPAGISRLHNETFVTLLLGRY